MTVDPVDALEERIRATFARLQTSGPLERQTILTDISTGDPDVHRAIVRLLDGVAPPAFASGDLVSNRFRIVSLLGKGGMGEVYEADDAALREHVALKTLPSGLAADARAVERLKREIALARRVTHPNVCRVFDVDQHQTPSGAVVTFFTMELLAGQTLSARLRRDGRMSPANALPLLRQMAAALGAAHGAGIVHGDFKPGNVMLVPTADAGERLVVTDFGLALPAQPGAPNALTVTVAAGWGTPQYMAPEQVAKDRLTPQTDIYALGVVAREMVAGELDARWRAAIAKCLEREPAARFTTTAQFVRALEAPDRRQARRRPWVAAAAGVAAAALLAAWLVPSIRTAREFRSAPGAGVAALPDRTVALLPLDDPDRTPDAAAFSRGLVVVLTEELHLVSVLDPSSRIRTVPTDEVLEGDLRTQEGARRTLGANVIVTGRVDRNDAERSIDVTLKVDQRSRSFKVRSGDRIVLPLATMSLAEVLDVKLSPAIMKELAEGGTTSPAAEELYLRGRGYLSRGESGVDAAIDALGRARQADTQFAFAAAALSDAYRQKYIASRDPAFIALAQSVGDEAIKLNSVVAYAHVVRGLSYLDTGQQERAIREFQAALAVDPTALNARRRLAETYEAQGSLREAEGSYRQEIASYPRYWAPFVGFGSFLIRHGRYAEAESNLLTAAQNAPDNVRVIGNLAGLYILTERFAAAEAELRRGLDAAPNAIGLNNLAWVYIYQGQLDKAVPILGEAVKSPGADSTHWSNLARVYRWTNQRVQARTTYETAIKMARTEIGVNPRNARIRANLASLLAETGRRQEALAEMASALERAPTDVSALFRSAVVHELTGDRAAALSALQSAARGGYSTVDIRRNPDLARLREDPRFLTLLTVEAKPALQ